MSLGQSDSISDNGFIIPKSLNECIVELDKTFTQDAKDKLISLDEDTIGYIYDILIIDEWLRSDSSRLITYFKNQGLRFTDEMEYFIILAYYKYLTTGFPDVSIKLKKYVSHIDSLSIARKIECEHNRLMDTLDGVYVPVDLIDCYKHLDYLLSDSLKLKMKNSTVYDMFTYHFSIGLWIRNNWGLWNCSRINKYFRDNNITHPDNMSGIIIQGYRLYLKDTICSINDIIERIPVPPPPPPASAQHIVKYIPPQPFRRHLKRFLRTKKIDDFEIGTYTRMK